MSANQRPTVIVIGAGFGGLYATKQLAKVNVDILLIDRHNFHLFSPLVYQVATSGLEAGEIAYPVRGILRRHSNVRFLLGSVEDIDPVNKTVLVKTNTTTMRESYDYLLIAAGSQTNFFGMEQVERYAFDLKDLGHAIVLRNHVLKCFENAAWTEDPARREALTTMVVVGGGPTGLETAGALCELYRYVLKKEFTREIPEMKGDVILVEMQDHLLDPYPPRLQRAARRQLEDMGVEVVLGERLVEVNEDCCLLSNGRVIPTYTVVWAAGVKSSPLAEKLGVPLQRSGRIPVRPTLQVIGNDASYDDIYVVGDMAYLNDRKGKPYPMLIPVAEEQGTHAAKNIIRRLKNKLQTPFKYAGLHDRGLMATIGRSRAVGWIFYKVELSGFIAWIAWVGLHIILLMGFRKRLNVFINWVWNYFTYDRSIRIILEHQPHGAFANTQDLGAAAPSEAHPEDEREKEIAGAF